MSPIIVELGPDELNVILPNPPIITIDLGGTDVVNLVLPDRADIKVEAP